MCIGRPSSRLLPSKTCQDMRGPQEEEAETETGHTVMYSTVDIGSAIKRGGRVVAFQSFFFDRRKYTFITAVLYASCMQTFSLSGKVLYSYSVGNYQVKT